MTRKALAKRTDALYEGDPADFTKDRDALAKDLRASGDDADATEVKALRKPTAAARPVNLLALSRKRDLNRFLKLGDDLRAARSAAKLRSLAAKEAELLDGLVSQAGELAPVEGAQLDRVRETLRAAQADDEVRELVRSARLDKERVAAGVGFGNLLVAPVKDAKPEGGGEAAKREAKKARAAKDRERTKKAKATLKDAESAERKAKREVAKAEGALAKAERTHQAALDRVERARAALGQ